MEDAKLLQLLLDRPDRGMEELMDQYLSLVWAVVKGRAGSLCSTQDLEECVSDVFTQFYRQRETIDPNRGSVKGYLCSIARRRATDLYRKAAGTPSPLSLDDEILSNSLPIRDEYFTEEGRRQVVEAIRGLDEPDREIIVRKFYFREPSKSIAQRLGMSVPAVDTRTHRALKKLRDRLEEQDETGSV